MHFIVVKVLYFLSVIVDILYCMYFDLIFIAVIMCKESVNGSSGYYQC
jgi:hypothetical protein